MSCISSTTVQAVSPGQFDREGGPGGAPQHRAEPVRGVAEEGREGELLLPVQGEGGDLGGALEEVVRLEGAVHHGQRPQAEAEGVARLTNSPPLVPVHLLNLGLLGVQDGALEGGVDDHLQEVRGSGGSYGQAGPKWCKRSSPSIALFPRIDVSSRLTIMIGHPIDGQAGPK